LLIGRKICGKQNKNRIIFIFGWEKKILIKIFNLLQILQPGDGKAQTRRVFATPVVAHCGQRAVAAE
jgi:hypothetical protein